MCVQTNFDRVSYATLAHGSPQKRADSIFMIFMSHKTTELVSDALSVRLLHPIRHEPRLEGNLVAHMNSAVLLGLAR